MSLLCSGTSVSLSLTSCAKERFFLFDYLITPMELPQASWVMALTLFPSKAKTKSYEVW
jgi:hypothetical protein